MNSSSFLPLNVFATPDSPALRRNDSWLADPANLEGLSGQIAPGFQPDSQYDLAFFGGRTIVSGSVELLYVGGDGSTGSAASWAQSDVAAIDRAVAQAFGHAGLESVIAQYFPSQPTLGVATSSTYVNPATTLQQSDVETMVGTAFAAGDLKGDPASTLFCFLLSPGTRLFASDGSDSYNGLGGYHGAVGSGSQNLYYAVGVYSQTASGVTNGIPAFPDPWKSVSATFYHEINEWRTDPDVESASGSNAQNVLGWYSQQYGEIGDIPITEAGQNLSEVFVEVPLATGSGTVPVQLMYSNHDHGPAESTAAAVGSALPGGQG